MATIRLVLALGLNAAIASMLPAAALNEFIAVSSTAAPDYVRPTDAQGHFRPESYIFSQGLFLQGTMTDSSLAHTTLMDIAKAVAPDLAKQNYFPTRNVPRADVLIVVHWGSTMVDDDPQRDRMVESLNVALPALAAEVADVGYGDTGQINQVSDFFSWTRENSNYSFARNAALLGYERQIKKDHSDFGLVPEHESAMRLELSEERYFVVLMAYDYQLFTKEKKKKLLWVTRLSVRASGNNFAEALPVLTQAGSHVFGRQLAGMAHLDANLREGVVSIKSLKSLGVTEAEDAKANAQ